MAQVKVRITRTWDVDVKADYGDTEAALIEKAEANGKPDGESRVVVRTPELEAALLSTQEGLPKDKALKQVTAPGRVK